ncbi:MAG TPA: SDR family NAD(P)-dependent oxidoreductase, partial [Rhizomicrobium sp.]|nr:SDR family NAD(P)-dependent oxidoreductase [Rhizomicrobium sp.]
MRLANKIAIVTGAASGFGEGIVRQFVAEGASVVVADINGVAAERLVRELGRDAIAVVTDVTKDADIANLADAALKQFGRIDIVVNNAGMGQTPQP